MLFPAGSARLDLKENVADGQVSVWMSPEVCNDLRDAKRIDGLRFRNGKEEIVRIKFELAVRTEAMR